MTNPSNLVQSQPISLVNQTVSFTITRNLQNSTMPNHVRALVEASFTRAWLDLKNSAQNFSLRHIMSNIERSFVESEQQSRKITFLPEQVNDVLEKNRDILFKTLAETFQAKRIFGSSIPVDISSYERLQRVLEDDALQTIWDLHLAWRFVFNGPAPTSLGEIKVWLKDPANAAQLNGVRTLNLSRLGLKAIPPELSALTQLQNLVLSENQISSIPDSLSNLSQLQMLFLSDNQISSIPDSLSKLSQLKTLYLSDNQISSIPDSLSNLSQLQGLELAHNQISSIPDSLGNLSQLQGLVLADNKISSIPDSLGSLSQLKTLDLHYNQINSIPDSLSNLSQLELLVLTNNQINNIPNSLASFPPQLWLPLNYNPLLFIYDKIIHTPNNILELVAQCSEFKEYKCLSSFSNLCQLMVQKSDNHQMIKEAFGNLKKNDQNLIFEMVYKVSGVCSDDPIWGEHHVFDDMNIFYYAVKKAIATKFDRLSLKEKNAVYGEIYQLAQPKTEDPNWGEHHFFDNVLRLIDAMDRIGL
jgi:Leucine-rich repeat (LRR) protein